MDFASASCYIWAFSGMHKREGSINELYQQLMISGTVHYPFENGSLILRRIQPSISQFLKASSGYCIGNRRANIKPNTYPVQFLFLFRDEFTLSLQ